mmetsp:Transcript_4352/g.10499  ORF Transcript_4352/g.10499 Transcript_4352/m.10499 type:complete len:256 (-) Transcript_4352:163-930(-)
MATANFSGDGGALPSSSSRANSINPAADDASISIASSLVSTLSGTTPSIGASAGVSTTPASATRAFLARLPLHAVSSDTSIDLSSSTAAAAAAASVAVASTSAGGDVSHAATGAASTDWLSADSAAVLEVASAVSIGTAVSGLELSIDAEAESSIFEHSGAGVGTVGGSALEGATTGAVSAAGGSAAGCCVGCGAAGCERGAGANAGAAPERGGNFATATESPFAMPSSLITCSGLRSRPLFTKRISSPSSGLNE